jgi:hypothetical protein
MLSTSSGSQSADNALRGLIGIFEMLFPGRIRAYYAEGSYADRTAIASSDIDLVLIFKNSFVDEAVTTLWPGVMLYGCLERYRTTTMRSSKHYTRLRSISN